MATIPNGKGCICLAAFDMTSVLKKHEIGRPSVMSNAVAIDIKYCGMCHTDIHMTNGDWGIQMWPMVPGHEIAGLVSAVGKDVTKHKVGDRVGMGCIVESCGSCDLCLEGQENHCPQMCQTYSGIYPAGKGGEECTEAVGHHTNGGYSTSIVVNEHFVFPIPDNISLEHAGPLLCAGITTYSPLNKYIAKRGGGQGKKVAVLGFGGLGHMAVKIAKAMGCEVAILSRSTAKKAAANLLDASILDYTNDDNIKSHGRTFDLVIDTVSAPHPVASIMGILKVGGVWCMMGGVTKPIEVSPFFLYLNQYTVCGSFIGGVPETQEMLDFCALHGIFPDIEVIPASAANAYFQELSAGVAGAKRTVIDMTTIKDL